MLKINEQNEVECTVKTDRKARRAPSSGRSIAKLSDVRILLNKHKEPSLFFFFFSFSLKKFKTGYSPLILKLTQTYGCTYILHTHIYMLSSILRVIC